MRSGKSFVAVLFLVATASATGCSKSDPAGVEPRWPDPDPLTISTPGFPPLPNPANNPLTRQGVALGRRLFYDPILSADSTQACGSCHRFGRSFSDSLRFSVGIDGSAGTRNASSLVNVAWLPKAFWDGRAASLEHQALEPVVNPIEMKETWPNVVRKLQRHKDYPELFGRAFGTDEITKELVTKAIAQFERTFVSHQSKFDIWLQTRDAAAAGFTAAQERGRHLFDTERGDCFHCHRVNVLATDNDFHNIGLDSTFVDLGRGDITGNPSDLGKFKTPTLRNVELTPPYMHDGRFNTLEEVVQHYNTGGFTTPTTDPLLRKRGVGLGLTPEEVSDIVEFLKTFTDTVFANNPDLANPN
jgi:cytochrome c peroxidase